MVAALTIGETHPFSCGSEVEPFARYVVCWAMVTFWGIAKGQCLSKHVFATRDVLYRLGAGMICKALYRGVHSRARRATYSYFNITCVLLKLVIKHDK